MKTMHRDFPKLVAILIVVVIAIGFACYGCSTAPAEEAAASDSSQSSDELLNYHWNSQGTSKTETAPQEGVETSTSTSTPTPEESTTPAQQEQPVEETTPVETPAPTTEESTPVAEEQPVQESTPVETSTPAPVETAAPVETYTTTETATPVETPAPEEVYVDPVPVEEPQNIANESVALEASSPAMPVDFAVNAPGIAVQSNERALVDYSNAADGYVMVCYTAGTDRGIKVLVEGPTGTRYQYNINAGDWVAMPLSDGSGSYRVGIYENVQGTSYAEALTAYFDAWLKDEYAPFMRSNQYVNIAGAPETVAMAQQICGQEPVALKKVQLIYDFVVNNFTYDQAKAASVQSGYVPNLDEVLRTRTGICFDYAALMTAMLRSQGVPCKLVIGYAGTIYHAWIDVWSQDNGWVSGAVYFDGNAWQRMDPTFASSGGQSPEIMQYIGDGQNYSAKYFY